MNSKSFFLAIFFCLLVQTVSYSQTIDTNSTQQKPIQMKNKLVPKFSGISLTGKQWNQDSIKGKVSMFSFWFIGCPGCMFEINSLNTIFNEYEDKDFILLSFAPQVREDLQLFNDTAKNSFSGLRVSFKAKPIKYEIIPTCEIRKPRKDSKYRYVMPECDSVVKDFKVNGYPLVLIVDKKGFIRYIHEGFIADPAGAEYLLNLYKTEIDSLLTN